MLWSSLTSLTHLYPANRKSTTPPAASSSTAETTTPSCTSRTWTSPRTPASTSATPPTRTAAARRSLCSGCAATWPPCGPCWASWRRSSSSSSSSSSTRSARSPRTYRTVSGRSGFIKYVVLQYLEEKKRTLVVEGCLRRRRRSLEVFSEVVPRGRQSPDTLPLCRSIIQSGVLHRGHARSPKVAPLRQDSFTHLIFMSNMIQQCCGQGHRVQ